MKVRNMKSTSGTVAVEKRSLGRIIRKISKGISIHTIKDDFDFSDNINSKTIAFDFVPSAETERNLISQRTDEALAVKKIAGVKSGRRGGRLRKGI